MDRTMHVMIGTQRKYLHVYSSNIYTGLIIKPKAYPKVKPTVNMVWVRKATDPESYFGVMPKIYRGMIPELSPIIMPTNTLPRKRGTKERSRHWTIILMIAQRSKIIIRYRCLIYLSNLSIKNAPKKIIESCTDDCPKRNCRCDYWNVDVCFIVG